MNFDNRLQEIAGKTDDVIAQLLPLEGAAAPRLLEAMRYSSLGQGKRLRPFFAVESARVLGADEAGAYRAAAAIECIHCYSLVHDDLPAMDDDDLRRGKPTCHKQFDEATAILAGDGLLTVAFEIAAHADTHPDAAVRCELVQALAHAAGHAGMVGGQMLDLAAEQKHSHDRGEIEQIQRLKTGALFGFSLQAGPILAQASPADRANFTTYAEKIGLAFQIADDILDVTSTPEQLGKATQKDSEAGKATFVDLLGLEGAKKEAAQLAAAACQALAGYGETAAILTQAARFIVERDK